MTEEISHDRRGYLQAGAVSLTALRQQSTSGEF
jgi:hypothetical protein